MTDIAEFLPDDLALQRASDRGQQAELILSNPVFGEAFDGLRQQIYDALAGADLRKHEEHVLLLQQLKLLERLRYQFESFVRAGEMAAQDLTHRRSVMERLADISSRGMRAAGLRR